MTLRPTAIASTMTGGLAAPLLVEDFALPFGIERGCFHSAGSITYIIVPAWAIVGGVGKLHLRCLLWDAHTKHRRMRFARPSP